MRLTGCWDCWRSLARAIAVSKDTLVAFLQLDLLFGAQSLLDSAGSDPTPLSGFGDFGGSLVAGNLEVACNLLFRAGGSMANWGFGGTTGTDLTWCTLFGATASFMVTLPSELTLEAPAVAGDLVESDRFSSLEEQIWLFGRWDSLDLSW